MKLYLIGSLRNPRVPEVAQELRESGYEVFDDWFAAGERADDSWQSYEKGRGRRYDEALRGYAADHVFSFDKRHLNASDAVILLTPAGKSAHLELGYCLGRGKLGYILIDEEPERWDVMYRFCNDVFTDVKELLERLECHVV